MVGHTVILRGAPLPGIGKSEGSPSVVSILEQDFVSWLLERLSTAAGRQELAGRDAFARRNDQEEARLWQPVHRAFNVVLVDAFCKVEGLPRLDPRKVLQAGVVVRRCDEDQRVGWVRSGGNILGWRQLPDADGDAPQWDPDPEIRKQVARGRNASVLRRATNLAAKTAEYEEAFAPLYPAPPELCAALGRTLFFGYLPLTSNERSEADPPPEAPFKTSEVQERLPVILWQEGRRAKIPEDDRPAAPLADTKVYPASSANPSNALAVVISGVGYLAQEPGLFTPQSESGKQDPTADLRKLLESYKVQRKSPDEVVSLYEVLEEVYDFLILRMDDTKSVRMPVKWPEFTAAQEKQFANAVNKAMLARWARLSPGDTRYQNLSARYELRAFARIDRSDHGCPPETVWTKPSDPFEIVPWYESGETPPTVVELPAPTREFMGKLKPNVAFKVPEEIQQFMSGLKLDALMDGEKPGPKLGFGMICGFSIPILTICAFIVLQIFLVLFHILFWWLPFIRICIPFPKK